MPSNANNLGSQIGQLLFGKPDSNKSYYEGQAIGSLVNDRMASANANRVKAMLGQDQLTSRQGVTPEAAIAAGFKPEAAPFLTAALRSNDTVDFRKLGDFANPVKMQAITDAKQAADTGDMTTANDNLAVFQGKPIETAHVTDGQVINPFGSSDQSIPLTALGTATVGEKNAGASEKYASAREHNALASLHDVQTKAGGFNPHSGATGKVTYPSAPDAAAYLGDSNNARAFTAWRSQHPEYANGDEAWIAYRAARPIGAPTGERGKGDEETPIYQPDLGNTLTLPDGQPITKADAVDLSNIGEQLTQAAKPDAAPAAKASTPAKPSTPKVGAIEGGYRFKGGDPSKAANWEKQ